MKSVTNWILFVIASLFSEKSGRFFGMQRTSNLGVWAVFMLLFVASSGCAREEPGSIPTEVPGVEIPLNKIWGHMIPGTQSIHRLESDHLQKLSEQERDNLQNNSLMLQIHMAIKRQEDNQPIGLGFAVAGSGYESLVAVEEAMEQNRIPSQTFPVGTEVSLFFFTRGLGTGFQLKEVRQSKETVSIRYQIIPDNAPGATEAASTRYFSLIPLGKPAAGNIAVNMIEQPTKRKRGKYDRRTFKQSAEGAICKSFSFSIKAYDNEASVNK